MSGVLSKANDPSVAKLFSGQSCNALSVPATLLTLKWLVSPLVSAPTPLASADVPVPLNSNLKPLLPKVNPLVSLGIHTPFFVSPKDDAASCRPSMKLTSDIYPSKWVSGHSPSKISFPLVNKTES